MTEVAATASAEDLGADHAVSGVTDLGDVLLGKGLVEAGPARAGVELRARSEEWQVAAGAEIDAIPVVIQQVTAEGGLGPLGAEDAVGRGAELLLPRGIGLHDTGALDDGAGRAIGAHEANGDGIGFTCRGLSGHERDHRKQKHCGQEMTGDHGKTLAQESEKYGTQELRNGKGPCLA